MNNYQGEARRRSQTLLIVEGNHEKNKLFWLIFKCQHLYQLPDFDYAERKIPLSLQPGKKYKALVAKETVISSVVEFPHRLDDLLKKHLDVSSMQRRELCCNKILNISDTNSMAMIVQMALQGVIEEGKLLTTKYQLIDWIKKQKYTYASQTYWEYTRNMFKQIIKHNICKANRIQYNQYQIEADKYKDCFENLDLSEILKIQNLVSKDEEIGFIWVLNTCVLFVAEYNFTFVQ